MFSLNDYVHPTAPQTAPQSQHARPLGAVQVQASGGLFRNMPIPQTVAASAPRAHAQTQPPRGSYTFQAPRSQTPLLAPAPNVAQVDRRRESADAVERELKETQKANLDLQKKLKAAATRISVLNHNRAADAQTAEFELTTLQKKLTKTTETNEQLSASLNTMHRDRAKVGETNASHQKQLSALQIQMGAAIAERDALRVSVEELKASRQSEVEAAVASAAPPSLPEAEEGSEPIDAHAKQVAEEVAGSVIRTAEQEVPFEAAPCLFKAGDVSAVFSLALPPCPVKTSSHAASYESLGSRANACDFAALVSVGANAPTGMMRHVMSDFTNEFWRKTLFHRHKTVHGKFYPIAATT